MNNSINLLRRGLACLLFLALVLALPLGTPAKAVGQVIGTDHPTEPGDVMLFKEVSEIEGLVNTWEVKLRVEAMDKPKPTDIVLVMDRSGSMGDDGRMANAKIAARAFVDALLDQHHPETRIALVSFASDVTTNRGFTNYNNGGGAASSGNTLLKNSINALGAEGGTLTQGGIKRARELLAGSSATNKVIVLLSDGEPTFSYQINSPWKDNNSNLVPYSNGYETPSNVPENQFEYGTRVGGGSTLRTQYTPWYAIIPRWYNHGNSAIAEAGFAKNALPSGSPNGIYTIALSAGAAGTSILNSISSGTGYAYNTSDPAQLTPIFTNIAGSISAAMRDATVSDPMGLGFQVPIGAVSNITVSPNGGVASYNSGSKEITWTIEELIQPVPTNEQPAPPDPRLKYAQLTYRVEINDNILSAEGTADGLFNTNGDATLTYTDSEGIVHTGIAFPKPEVNPVLMIIEKVLLDAFGRPITNDEYEFTVNVVHQTQPEDYNQNYQMKHGTHNRRVITGLRETQSYTAKEIWPAGHTRSEEDYTTTTKIGDELTNDFTIHSTEDPDFSIVVTNQEKPLGKLTIKKTLVGGATSLPADWETGNYPRFEIKVTGPVQDSNGDVSQQLIATHHLMAGGESVTMENLPYGTYTIEETTASGFTTTYKLTAGLGSPEDTNAAILNVDNKEATLEVINDPINTSVQVRKTWAGGELDGYPSDIGLKLYRKIAGGEETEVSVTPTHTGSAPAAGSGYDYQYDYLYSDLPSVDEYGRPYIYRVDETIGFLGFERTGPTWNETAQRWDIANVYQPIQIKAKKVFQLPTPNPDNVELPNPLPTIPFLLFKDGVRYPSVEINQFVTGSSHVDITHPDGSQSGELDDGTWVYTWSYLPKYNEDGSEAVYTVGEIPPTNFVREPVYQDDDGMFIVTNTYRQGTFRAHKYWYDVDGELITNPPSGSQITYDLYQEAIGVPPSSYSVNMNMPVTLDGTPDFNPTTQSYGEESRWHAIWTGLASNGTITVDGMERYVTFKYTIKETFRPAGYDAVTSASTHVYNRPNTADITANKVWVNGDTLTRPAVYFRLLRTKVNADLTPITGEIAQPIPASEPGSTVVTLNGTETDPWHYNWPDMPIYVHDSATPENSYAWVYTVQEVIPDPENPSQYKDGAPDNYTKKEEGLTVTNTYESPKVTKTAVKIWVNGPSTHPEIWFKLYRNIDGSTPAEVEPSDGGGKKDLPPGTTLVSWTDLDETDSQGNPYIYSILEGYYGENGAQEDGPPPHYTVQYATEAYTPEGQDPITDALIARNYYKATGEITLSGSKAFSGRDATDADEFTFELYKDSVDSAYLLGTKTVTGTDTFSFDQLTFTVDLLAEPSLNELGDHTFVIKEQVPTSNPQNGITYDAAVYTLTVTVTDNGDGTLKAEITGVEKSGEVQTAPFNIDFTNTYTSQPVTLGMAGNKSLTGRAAPMTENEFSFTLYASNSDWVVGDAINAAIGHAAAPGGAIAYPSFTYSYGQAGDYYYILAENATSVGGVIADDSIYYIKITVKDNGLGQMVIDSVQVRERLETNFQTVTVNNGVVDYEFDFENSYTATSTSLTLAGVKTIPARPGTLAKDEFTFSLYNSDDAWVEGAKIGESVGNAATTGAFSFPAISYADGSEGTHYYLMKEDASSVGGVTIDSHVYKVKVVVTDDGTGQMKVTSVEVDGVEKVGESGFVFSFDFENSYTATSTSLTFEGIKTLTGRLAALAENEFTFQLSGTGISTTLEEKNDASGNFSFGPLSLTSAGPYTYQLKEKTPSGVPGISDDTTTYAIVVTVTDDGLGQLHVTSVKVDGVEKFVENELDFSFDFMNSYTMSLEAVKVWVDQNNAYDLRPESVTVELLQNGSSLSPAQTGELNKDNSWKHTFTGLPETDSTGNLYTYTLDEITVVPGYTTTYDDANPTVTNTMSTVDVVAQKVYVPASGTLPPVGFDLMQNGKKLGATAIVDGTIEADTSISGEHSAWVYTWKNLPQTDKDGNNYIYTVREPVIPAGYVMTQMVDNNGVFVFTNTWRGGTFTAKKLWVPEEVPEGTTVTLELWQLKPGDPSYAKNMGMDALMDGVVDTGDPTTDNMEYAAWSFIWHDLPGNDPSTQEPYKYEVREGTLPLGYDTSSSASTVVENTATLTNFTATKLWEGGAKPPVTFRLMRLYDGASEAEQVGSVTLTGEGIGNGSSTGEWTPPDENTWKYTWTKLEKYHSPSTFSLPYTYFILEDELEGYTGTPNDLNTPDTYTNVYSSPLTNITATKVWDGGPEEDHAAVELGLWRSISGQEPVLVEGVMPEIDPPSGTADSFTYTWKGQPTHDQDGNAYTYYVEEHEESDGQVVINGNRYAVTMAAEPDPTITNTFVPPGALEISLDVEKKLVGAALKAGQFGFQMTGDGVDHTVRNDKDGAATFPAIVFTEPGDLTVTIKEIDEKLQGITYDTSVYAITITVEKHAETNTLYHSYVVKKDGADYDGHITFTNTMEPDPDPIRVPVQVKKVTEGFPLKAGDFEFTLYDRPGNAVETVKNNDKGDVVFDPIRIRKAGTYTFTIKEKQGTGSAISYDQGVIQVRITATEVGGTLNASVSYSKDGTRTANPTFTNRLQMPPTGDQHLRLPLILLALAALMGVGYVVIKKRGKKA